MKERPILYSPPMVLALLDGRKTQTRRVVNMQTLKVVPRFKVRGDWCDWQVAGKRPTPATMNQHGAVCGKATNGKMLGLKPGEFDFVCPYLTGKTELIDHRWIIGPDETQRLWVRESFLFGLEQDHLSPMKVSRNCGVTYIADLQKREYWHGKNRPSIHMPRWASRINLDIAKVRVERLQDIRAEDALAEGVDWDGMYEHPRDNFIKLWDSINGNPRKGGLDISWAANPWVWVIDFKRVRV